MRRHRKKGPIHVNIQLANLRWFDLAGRASIGKEHCISVIIVTELINKYVLCLFYNK